MRPKAAARYSHPYDSMKHFARLLALRYDMARTRHSYYRDLRLVHEPFQSEPAGLTGEHLRDYILHVKTVEHRKPMTVS